MGKKTVTMKPPPFPKGKAPQAIRRKQGQATTKMPKTGKLEY